MKNFVFTEANCCGCAACFDLCPQHAISMQENDEGFLYPLINYNLCINCNLCQNKCAFNHPEKYLNTSFPITYGVRHKSENIRSTSRSGGAFTLLSDWILEQNGIIYGAAFDTKFNVIHQRASTALERDSFKRSKYVQSNTTNIYPSVKSDLLSGKYVLFTGTACQIAGLKAYLQKQYDKLYTCDIVCHGVPSPKLWKEYVDYIEKKYKGKINYIDFRSKQEFGWKSHIEKFIIDKKNIYSTKFRQLFYGDSILRPSCYNCKYTSIYRPADITLADFWGYPLSKFNDNKGLSLIMLHNNKAVSLFEEVKQNALFVPYDTNQLIHPNLKKPTSEPADRSAFWETYYNIGFKGLLKKYTMPDWLEKMLIFLNYIKNKFK